MSGIVRKICFALIAMPTLLLARPVVAAQSLDLSDCRILLGQSRQKEFDSTIAVQRRKAETGDLAARKLLGAVANNRFACYLEEFDDGAGWSVTMSEPDKDSTGRGMAVSSTRVVDAAKIKKNPAVEQALREAFAAAQTVADEELAYRNMAATFVADYAEALPGRYRVAYRDAVGVREVACRSPEVLAGVSAQTFCLSAKAAVASLYRRLSAEQRSAEETAGESWAAHYIALKNAGGK